MKHFFSFGRKTPKLSCRALWYWAALYHLFYTSSHMHSAHPSLYCKVSVNSRLSKSYNVVTGGYRIRTYLAETSKAYRNTLQAACHKCAVINHLRQCLQPQCTLLAFFAGYVVFSYWPDRNVLIHYHYQARMSSNLFCHFVSVWTIAWQLFSVLKIVSFVREIFQSIHGADRFIINMSHHISSFDGFEKEVICINTTCIRKRDDIAVQSVDCT